ncbi:MAG: DUF2905 domain-containing protein [Anaerolineales bacterium]|nr:MAG: DUF2905 domain-containing protein [Anaerolineales bacterium]
MPELTVLARWILIAGLGLLLLGGMVWVLGRLNIPLGQLPGDFRFQRGNIACFFPLVTSLLLSGILTLLINLILRLLKK